MFVAEWFGDLSDVSMSTRAAAFPIIIPVKGDDRKVRGVFLLQALSDHVTKFVLGESTVVCQDDIKDDVGMRRTRYDTKVMNPKHADDLRKAKGDHFPQVR